MSSNRTNTMDSWTVLDEPNPEKAEQEEAEQKDAEKEETDKQERAKQEVAKEEVDKEEVGKEEVAKEEVHKEEVDKEEVAKEEMHKEKVDKEEVAKEEVAKEEMHKEEVDKEEVDKEEVAKEEVKKQEAQKEQVDKEEEVHKVKEKSPAELKQERRLQQVISSGSLPTTDEVEEDTRERREEEEKKQEQQERRGEEKEDQATCKVAPSPLSETEGRRHSVRWVLVFGVMLSLLYTVVVYYICREWQTRITTAEWERKYGVLVAEEMRVIEEERRSLANLAHDVKQEEKTEAQRAWKRQLAFIGAIAALATACCTREVCRVIKSPSVRKADAMKEALESALTHHYKAEPISVLGLHRFTHVFTGIEAARRHGQTLRSLPLCFPNMMHLGVAFILSLRMTGGVSLRVNILTDKPAVETPGHQIREQVLDVLMRKCSLRLIPQGAATGVEPRETMLHLVSDNFQEMLREDELESGHWIKGDMLVAQVELVFGTW